LAFQKSACAEPLPKYYLTRYKVGKYAGPRVFDEVIKICIF
jgi:hypothetical protein